MNREDFLARLRARPAGAHLPEEGEAPPRPTLPEDLCVAFCEAARATGSRTLRGDKAAIGRALREFSRGEAVLAQEAEELATLLDGVPLLPPHTDPFTADWGLSLAEAGLAHTGSACIRREKGRSLLASLVPPRAAIVVRAKTLVWELGDYLQEAPAHGTVHVVSGPSRSADIENDLSIGVHGPGEVLYLLWEE
ncbi:MAG: LUD domain-containing protein [Thermaerobacter sp.]|nr:LUD domain-containing protein [Thermaerobacter sp.]